MLGGFEASRMDQASMKRLVADVDGSKINFSIMEHFGSFSGARWKRP